MAGGYIKIHRQMLEWEWWSDSNTTRLWLYLLLAANYEDKKWQGITIERGQLVTSLEHLSQQTGLSIQQVRTCIARLKTTNEITSKTTNKYSIITICKYVDYQVNENDEQQAEQQTMQQTNNKQITITKEIKNINKEISTNVETKKDAGKPATLTLEERKKVFYLSLVPYVETYGKEMIRAFYNYWVQVNPNGTKMLWEKQRAFELARRLKTWADKESIRPVQKSPVESRKHFDSDTEQYTDGTI